MRENDDMDWFACRENAMQDALSDAGTFRNPQTPADALPDYRELEFEPVAEGFRGYTLLTTLIYWLPIFTIASAMNLIPGLPAVVGILLPAGVLSMALLIGVYRWADAGHRGWAVRAHDIVAREGIYWRAVTILPFARIQHVETSSGPLERWRGLSRLKLFTAGGMTADLTLLGLAAGTADNLREHLAEQIRLRDALVGELDGAAKPNRPEE